MLKSKIWKTGILLVLLGVPVFILIFLNVFGKNNFDLPRYYPLVNSRDEIQLNEKGDTLYHKIPSFSLLDQDSVVFESPSLVGKSYVVSFFFTRCGTICPIMNENLYRVYDRLDPEFLRMVSISVDPEYDTPEKLLNYSESKEINTELWYFLTGEKAKVYEIILNAYKLPVSDASEYNETISLDETFIHSEKALLIDAEGVVRGIYDATNVADIERLMMEIDVLKSNL